MTRLTILLLAVGLAGCGAQTASSTAPSAPSGGAHALSGVKKGHVHFNPLAGASSDAQAMHKLSWTRVDCGWNNGHVWAHGVFHNALGASVTVDVLPTYRLRNAGQHGDTAGGDSQVKVAAGGKAVWWVDAGAPGGVTGHPQVTACLPEIESVSLG